MPTEFRKQSRSFAFHLISLFLFSLSASPNSLADIPAQSLHHPAADAVRQIVQTFYAPFADYVFQSDPLCLPTDPVQVFINVYLRSPDGSTAPSLQSLCISRPSDGELLIQWELGPTDEAKLFVLAGEDEETVKSHDFWHVGISSDVISSQKLQLNELVFERDGGIAVKTSGDSASIQIEGVSISLTIPNSKVPQFLTQDIGIDSFDVSSDDLFTAKLSAPLFNIPIEAVGDIGPQDQMSLEILGFSFRIH